MPEPAAALLRRGMDTRELNALLVAGRGSIEDVVRTVTGVKTIEEAEQLVAAAKVSAEKILSRPRGAMSERPLVTVLSDLTGVPAETLARSHEEAGRSGSSTDDPPPGPPASASSFEEPDPSPSPPRRRMGPGQRRALVIEYIREHGPIRQMDLGKQLAMDSGSLSVMVQALVAERVVERGEKIERSPLLMLCTTPAEAPPEPEPEPEPEPPALEPVREVPSVELVVAPEPPPAPAPLAYSTTDLYFDYLSTLLMQARTPGCAEHIFDRIEKLLDRGPPEVELHAVR